MADVIVLNEITELLNSVNSGLSSTLSTINSNVNTVKTNVATILTNTNTNNTASTTGTLSQKISSAISNTAATTTENVSGTLSAKLTYLINRRAKFITPGSTNLKTLNSSGSVSITEQTYDNKGTTPYTKTFTADGTKYTCNFKYVGTYRFYATASLSITAKGDSWPGVKNDDTAICGGKLICEIYHVASNTTTTHSVNIFSSASSNVSATTKTVDAPVQIGDKLTAYIQASSTTKRDACSNTSTCAAMKITWTDISIRGTVNEIDGATT